MKRGGHIGLLFKRRLYAPPVIYLLRLLKSEVKILWNHDRRKPVHKVARFGEKKGTSASRSRSRCMRIYEPTIGDGGDIEDKHGV